MSEDDKKLERRQEKSANETKIQKDEDITDFAAAGEADTRIVPKPTRKSSPGAKMIDPRDDEFVPGAISEDAAREAASSEYVSFDQPLDEPPARKMRKKSKVQGSKKPTPGRKAADSRSREDA